MTRRTHRAAIAAIATALVSIGGLPPAQAVESPQAGERRWECVREKKISGIPVGSLLCLKVIWDESAETTTLVAKLKVTNGTRSNRSMLIRLSSRPGVFTDHDSYDYTLAPGSSVTYTKRRKVSRDLDHPVAKSRVALYSGETDDYTIAGKTLRATP